MVEKVLVGGINYIEIVVVYGESEVYLGELLKEYNCFDIYFISKVCFMENLV